MDILIDWGSTNFRAFRLVDNKVVDRRDLSGGGIFKSFAPGASQEQNYSGFLKQELGSWLSEKPNASILMCGMVGSREGWATTPFTALPAGFPELADRLFYLSPEQKGVLKDCEIAIVPGISMHHASGRYDVIRSEEIKALGALHHLGVKDGVLSIPGTHCKWMLVKNSKVVEFHTIPSGEIYGLLHEGGAIAPILKSSPPVQDSAKSLASFDRGLELAKEGSDLLADIWQVRPQKLLSPNPPEDLPAYLSGILIGHELHQVSKLYPNTKQITLVSDGGSRQAFYKHAIEKAGMSVQAVIDNETAVCSGLIQLSAATTEGSVKPQKTA